VPEDLANPRNTLSAPASADAKAHYASLLSKPLSELFEFARTEFPNALLDLFQLGHRNACG
jgi:hypothetical protein